MDRPYLPKYVTRSNYTIELEKYCDELERINKELINTTNQYRWHDLRKDPKDLPPTGMLVELCIKTISDCNYYTLASHMGTWKNETRDLFPTHNFIAWKYIEDFEN